MSVFWNIATSDWAIGLDLALLIAALIVGHLPLIGRIPAVAPYVVLARAVAYLVLALMMLCVGHRIADEGAALKQAKIDLAFSDLQLSAQKQTAETAEKLRMVAETKASVANEKVADYEQQLASRSAASIAAGNAGDACDLDGNDVGSLRGIAK